MSCFVMALIKHIAPSRASTKNAHTAQKVLAVPVCRV